MRYCFVQQSEQRKGVQSVVDYLNLLIVADSLQLQRADKGSPCEVFSFSDSPNHPYEIVENGGNGCRHRS